MFREGVTVEALGNIDSRRYLPLAVAATVLVIVAPALIVLALSPLHGIADIAVSALLAGGLSVAAGHALGTLWARQPLSREMPFGDLMLWTYAGRVVTERRLVRDLRRDGGEPELAALRRLAVVFEARAGATHGHSGRVARHAGRIARRMRLADDEVGRIEAAASVHDIGLLGVPSAIRDNPAPTAEDEAVIARHVTIGAERVAAATDGATAAIVRHHHERYDGTGIPDGLAGEAIPLGARIVAVADRFDELLSQIPGGAAVGRRNALDQLAAEAGSELDPDAVAACVAYYSGLRGILGVALAATMPQRAVRWLAAAPAGVGGAGAPAVVQGVCAAGALAVAGSCLGGLPAIGDQRERARPAVERAAAGDRTPSGPVAAVQASPAAGAPAADRGAARRGDRGDDAGRRRDDRSGGDRRRGATAPPPAGQQPTVGAPPSGGDGGGSPQPGSGDGGAPRGGSLGGGTPGGATPGGGTSDGGATGGGGRGASGDPASGGSAGAGGGGNTPQPAPPASPPTVADVTGQVLDPVLDGVGETVPPVKPVTDAVKEVVGGLLGGRRR